MRPNSAPSRVDSDSEKRPSQTSASKANAATTMSTITELDSSITIGVNRNTPTAPMATGADENGETVKYKRQAIQAVNTPRKKIVAGIGAHPGSRNSPRRPWKSGGHMNGAIFG